MLAPMEDGTYKQNVELHVQKELFTVIPPECNIYDSFIRSVFYFVVFFYR